MNNYWSQYVQLTEELYCSRALKFRKDNMYRWIDAMQLKDGQNLLEIGCAGGVFSHRIKQNLPSFNYSFDFGNKMK